MEDVWQHQTTGSLCVFNVNSTHGLAMQCITADKEQLDRMRCAMYRLHTCTQKVCILESISCWKVLTSPALTACVDTITVSPVCPPHCTKYAGTKAVLGDR